METETDADGSEVIVDPDQIIPLIDGGTEGMKGHARLILPRITGCFDCALSLFPPPTVFQECTIVNTPRTAAHCVAYAQAQFAREATERLGPLDKDVVEHMDWIVRVANDHASKFGLTSVLPIGMTEAKGIVGNIIPAIASTNAVIAAIQAAEAVKIATEVLPNLDNYLMYNGGEGVYTSVFEFGRDPGCVACGAPSVRLRAPSTETVAEFIERLGDHPQYQLKAPAIKTAAGKSVWIPAAALRAVLTPNLSRPLVDFADAESATVSLLITDPSLPSVGLEVTVELQDGP